MPGRMPGTGHPLLVKRHPPGLRRLRPTEFPRDMLRFLLAHPPYWRQKLYANDPRDLSRTPTLEHFLDRYGQFIATVSVPCKPGGKLAILMGDYSDREAGFIPLTYHTKRLAFAAGLEQHGTDIIRFSHGASSSKKVYRSSSSPACTTCAWSLNVLNQPLERRTRQ